MTDVELIQELRKRFPDSCLEMMEVARILESVGLTNIKHFLDNKELKVIKKSKRK